MSSGNWTLLLPRHGKRLPRGISSIPHVQRGVRSHPHWQRDFCHSSILRRGSFGQCRLDNTNFRFFEHQGEHLTTYRNFWRWEKKFLDASIATSMLNNLYVFTWRWRKSLLFKYIASINETSEDNISILLNCTPNYLHTIHNIL